MIRPHIVVIIENSLCSDFCNFTLRIYVSIFKFWFFFWLSLQPLILCSENVRLDIIWDTLWRRNMSSVGVSHTLIKSSHCLSSLTLLLGVLDALPRNARIQARRVPKWTKEDGGRSLKVSTRMGLNELNCYWKNLLHYGLLLIYWKNLLHHGLLLIYLIDYICRLHVFILFRFFSLFVSNLVGDK